MFWLTAFLNLLLIDGVTCFSSTPQRTVMKMESSLLDKIPNPFASKSGESDIPSAFKSDNSFNPTPDGLVLRAKAVLAADFGVLDESLLDSNFIWIGPTLGSKVLGKADFLAAGKFFDLRSTFPDLDYRPHDFRVDDKDPMTIRLSTRTVGSMRGDLRLRNEVVPPSGVRMVCPPEAVTMTFDEETGKLIKLCSGFAMDRLVGNTGGLCGVMGAAAVAGVPPSDWEVYPATNVLQRFLGRPVQQLEEPSSFLAPFPEQVMIQLAKGIIAADMAALDPDLLGPSFSFCTPYLGPVEKNGYIDTYAQKVLGDSDPELTNFRVDPYDPYRVWLDVLPAGGSPQAMSFTFDDDGFCTRITAWAVMDPSVGNSGGLGGEYGVQYANGSAPPGIISRPLPQVLGRLQKRLLGIVTNVGVDEYRLEGTGSDRKALSRPSAADKGGTLKLGAKDISPAPPSPFSRLSLQPKGASPKPSTEKKIPPTSPFSRLSLSSPTRSPKPPSIKTQPAASRVFAVPKSPSISKITKSSESQKASSPLKRKPNVQKQQRTRDNAQSKKQEQQAAKKKQMEQQLRAKEEAQAKATALAAERKRAAEQKKQELARRQKEARQLAAEKKKETVQAAAELKRQREEEQAAKVAAMKASADARRKEAEAKRTADATKAAKAVERARPGATISLFGFGSGAEAKEGEAPAAVAEAKRMEAEKRRREAQEKKAAATAAAEARRQEAAVQRAAAAKAKRATQAVEKAKPGATIALFGFGRSAEEEAEPSSKPVPAPKKSAPPRGIPTISGWSENSDGSISGKIFGADNFRDGEVVTTSPIRGAASGGRVVQTISGSKYFLEPQSEEKQGGGFFSRFGGVKQAASTPIASAAGSKGSARQSRQKAEVIAQERKAKAEQAAAILRQQQEKKPKVAPRGVPTLTKWRQNFDKSLTGLISGSTMFEDGERITTSEITTADVSKGSVVQTSSGSKYFLS